MSRYMQLAMESLQHAPLSELASELAVTPARVTELRTDPATANLTDEIRVGIALHSRMHLWLQPEVRASALAVAEACLISGLAKLAARVQEAAAHGELPRGPAIGAWVMDYFAPRIGAAYAARRSPPATG